MKKLPTKILALAIVLFVSLSTVRAQYVIEGYDDDENDKTYNQFSFGAGFGHHYGGLLGVNFSYAPLDFLSVTASVGTVFFTVTAGIGANVYFIPKSRNGVYKPNLKLQYGYTSAIWIINVPEYNKVYYGPRVGFGNEFRFGRQKRHGFDIDLFYIVLSDEYRDDLTIVQNDPDVDDFVEAGPFGLSIGYHFDF